MPSPRALLRLLDETIINHSLFFQGFHPVLLAKLKMLTPNRAVAGRSRRLRAPGPQGGRGVLGGAWCVPDHGAGELAKGPGLGSGLLPLRPHCVNGGSFLARLGLCFLLCGLGNSHSTPVLPKLHVNR